MSKSRCGLLLVGLIGFALLLGAADDPGREALQQGLAAWRAGRFDAALNFFSAAVDLDPNLLAARFWRGRVYVAKERWEEAERDLQAVLARKPGSVESLYWLGQVREAQGQPREARDCYQKALQFQPQHAEATAALERLKAVRRLLPPFDPPPGVGERAAALWRKLATRQDVTVVVLGDSLSFGMGVEDSHTDAFPFLLRTMLQEQFANPRVRVIDAGVAGETSAQGLGRLESHVLAQNPDLLIVQFGGNDSRNLSRDDYRRNLQAIVERTREECSAEVLLATPPMDGPGPDSPLVKAAKEIGEETGTPVADFDAALRSREHDYRGFFPNYAHPNEYGHAIMAQALWTTFRKLMNMPETVEVTIAGQAGWATLGTEAPVSVRVKNLSGEPQSGELTLTAGEEEYRAPFDLAEQEARNWTLSLPLPEELPEGRSEYQRLRATARSAQGAAFDFKWLTLAPRLACPARDPEADPSTAMERPRVILKEAHVVEGRERWDGPADLSAAFALAQDADTFYVQVEVTDDHIVPQGSWIPAYNDCVELFFDLRPLAQRGQPFYTPKVFLVFIHPASQRLGVPRVIPLDAPRGIAEQWEFRGTRTEDGYTLSVAIPRDFLEGIAGRPLTSFGFDVAVDDADTAGERQTQLMWAGTEHNFGNPQGFGEVVGGEKGEGEKTVRISVW